MLLSFVYPILFNNTLYDIYLSRIQGLHHCCRDDSAHSECAILSLHIGDLCREGSINATLVNWL